MQFRQMPELPEVESAVRRLRRAVVGKTIADVSVIHPALRRRLSPAKARTARGARILTAERRGKHQLMTLDDGRVLHAHFRMSGDWTVDRADDELPRGSPQWQLAAGLAPVEGEPRVDKQFNSAFEQTGLEDELARLGVSHIALAGAATNWCIRATAYGALDRGYDLTLIEDAHTTDTIELESGTRIEAGRVVDELNIAMTWLRYPGRSNGTATAGNVAFAVPRVAR